MKRLFWLAMGITIGALIVRKISAAIEKLTPQGIANGIGTGLRDLANSIGEFSGEVQQAMHEREHQLRTSTGLDGTLGAVPDQPGAAASE